MIMLASNVKFQCFIIFSFMFPSVCLPVSLQCRTHHFQFFFCLIRLVIYIIIYIHTLSYLFCFISISFTFSVSHHSSGSCWITRHVPLTRMTRRLCAVSIAVYYICGKPVTACIYNPVAAAQGRICTMTSVCLPVACKSPYVRVN